MPTKTFPSSSFEATALADVSLRHGTPIALMIVGPETFNGDDWRLAGTAIDATVLIDVAEADTQMTVDELIEFAGLSVPDMVVVDTRWVHAQAFMAALFTDAKAKTIPVMLLSSDGDESPDRFRCGVWEDPAPTDFDEIVALLGSYQDRTAVQRMTSTMQILELIEHLLTPALGIDVSDSMLTSTATAPASGSPVDLDDYDQIIRDVAMSR